MDLLQSCATGWQKWRDVTDVVRQTTLPGSGLVVWMLEIVTVDDLLVCLFEIETAEMAVAVVWAPVGQNQTDPTECYAACILPLFSSTPQPAAGNLRGPFPLQSRDQGVCLTGSQCHSKLHNRKQKRVD